MLNVMSIDKSDFSNEMSFMLLILREDIILEEETVKRYISNINWDNFLKLVTHHRVYSLMYVKLNKIGSSLIQEEVMLALRQLYKNNTVKMLQLTRELCVVCRTLNDQGIRSIVLKGPVLALHLYGELSHRTSKDLDILIDTNDVERTKKVLEKLGYCPDNTDAHLFWKKKSHHISFLHSLHSTQIEIHWRLNPDIISSPSFEELWQNKKIMVIYNQEFNHLGDEDLFAYLADHVYVSTVSCIFCDAFDGIFAFKELQQNSGNETFYLDLMYYKMGYNLFEGELILGILSRFRDIMKVNVNALLDRTEDPEKTIVDYMLWD